MKGKRGQKQETQGRCPPSGERQYLDVSGAPMGLRRLGRVRALGMRGEVIPNDHHSGQRPLEVR